MTIGIKEIQQEWGKELQLKCDCKNGPGRHGPLGEWCITTDRSGNWELTCLYCAQVYSIVEALTLINEQLARIYTALTVMKEDSK
jgi:hypothetical protein